MAEMNSVYNPKEFEEKLYQHWMDKDAFHAEIDPDKEPYTIVMPPPNVTGNLHMGHALNNTLQDILIRTKRMQGYSALWLPGMDHASISTEARVVNKLREEGKSKDDLGREAFLEETWDWTYKYGGTIRNQLKKLGVSCDWERERFTLDEELSEAVEEVFIRLYDKGLIYRGDRIINWCPSCATAISDAEVDHEDVHSHIWHFRYPVVGREGEYIQIATTRPETIPGDLAVAVNPEDERYKDMVGQHVLLPVLNREIPIIADDYVDMEFGTGAVKITPSHDPNDFQVGERHNLGQCIIMNEDATLNENAGKYNGMNRFEARKEIIKDFDELGFFVKEENHDNAIGHCERCNEVIEPLLSKQWFVEMKPLAKPALEAYKNGELNIIPERFGKIYTQWLENIQDWCISRQLWWGHRLPVWYCDDCGETIVSREEPTHCTKCNSTNLRRDEDTLDTWFSSALWPFSTLGWPKKTPEYDYFYPTNVLVTGYDIIFFWVIRMVFSALELTGELPFKDVYLNGLVRDAQGRKMSKSLGNGIDPLEVIDQYGADALRFTLITGTSSGGDVRFSKDRIEASRNFANKLWNASRFVLMNLPEDFKRRELNEDELEPMDKWILSRAKETIGQVETKIDKYDLGLAAEDVHEFTWHDYCDWYIEMVKPRLYGEDEESKDIAHQVLMQVLEIILKLLHPFMPFITEEIWSYLPQAEADLMVSPWPKEAEMKAFPEEEAEIEYVQQAIRGIRNARAESGIEPHRKSQVIVLSKDPEIRELLMSNEGNFKSVGQATELHTIDSREDLKENALSIVLDRAELFLPMAELVDYEKEVERLSRECEKLEGEIKRAKGKLANEGFVKGAPAHIVEEERDKLNKYENMLEQVKTQLEMARLALQ